MIKELLVVGSGSAGLIAALSLKRKLPSLHVRIVRSPDIGVIGVGEGTTPNFPRHLFEFLGISRKRFYELAEPTWKLGIRFLWGARGRFDYTFDLQLDHTAPNLPAPNGYYCDDSFAGISAPSALMLQGKAFPRQENGCPDIQGWHAFHIENKKFVDVLEMVAREQGVEIIDGRVSVCERGPAGVSAVHLEDGRKLTADFFVDCTGFRSELLGKTLQEPFVSFGKSLFCDRAVVGGWDRAPDEPILPYTTAEQMDAGWAWQIEHEHHVNRGYVYSSDHISDEQAAEEFIRKNPKAPKSPRVVRFRSGCHRRLWVDNVVAVGNSAGFVEPLEATALMIICSHLQTLVEFLNRSGLNPTPTMRDLYNDLAYAGWMDIKDFLALHYWANQSGQTPFWQRCRHETDVSGIRQLLDFYAENGPTGFCRYRLPRTENDFGVEGYLVMLVGNKVPYAARHQATEREKNIWASRLRHFDQTARQGLTVAESLAYIRHPGWTWHGDQPAS